MARKKKAEEKVEHVPHSLHIESFRPIDSYEASSHDRFQEPSCFNGIVSIRKYKITCEEIGEPVEVLHQRLQYLWDHSDNWHDHDHLVRVAKSLGYEFINPRGSLAAKKSSW